jgi:hypothetical protein
MLKAQIPLESQEQEALFNWVSWTRNKIPELELLFAIPNGGWRYKATAAALKREGVKSGVPDLCLPVARGGYHGMWIELKRIQNGTVSLTQRAWLEQLPKQGYYAVVCKGWQNAADEITKYLKGDSTRG